jgi:hypothetical protein
MAKSPFYCIKCCCCALIQLAPLQLALVASVVPLRISLLKFMFHMLSFCVRCNLQAATMQVQCSLANPEELCIMLGHLCGASVQPTCEEAGGPGGSNFKVAKFRFSELLQ